MLEYEKKLHLDEHYEKLRSMSGIGAVVCFLWSAAGFAAGYMLLKWLLAFLPSSSENAAWLTLLSVDFVKADAAYFAVGLLVTCWASYRLSVIMRENRAARASDGETPKELLTTGVYASVRHPMYGMFAFLQAGTLLALRSGAGILLAAVIVGCQFVNAVFEERRVLRPRFKNEYSSYAAATTHILFTVPQAVVLTMLFAVSVIGQFII